MKLDKVHALEIEMLKYFDYFCKQNNLVYMIDGGTLLGAVRHGNFIPWDDDVDIIMTREQYEILKSLSIKFENDNFKLLFIDNSSDYYYPYIKMINKRTKLNENNHKEIKDLGLFIDVFPMDKVPNSIKKRKIFLKTAGILRHLYGTSSHLTTNPNDRIKRILSSLIQKIPTRLLATILSKYATKYNNRDCDNYANLVGNPREIVFSNQLFEKTKQLKFGDLSLPAPQGYEAYLTANYGDYMQLPPVDKQVNHGLDVFIKQ